MENAVEEKRKMKDYNPEEVKGTINEMVETWIKEKATCGEDIQKINRLRNEANRKLDKEISGNDQ